MSIKIYQQQFIKMTRKQREDILCAMIRINYGTPWQGDLEVLASFFPKKEHVLFQPKQLQTLIDALTPYSDEPTHSSYKMPSDHDITITEVSLSGRQQHHHFEEESALEASRKE